MVEIKEVLRQWLARAGKKRIASRLGLDVKTVRRYTAMAESAGLRAGDGVDVLTDGLFAEIVAALKTPVEREHGETWAQCEAHREFISAKLTAGVRLSKVRRLLLRDGLKIPYSTLHRYAVEHLGFGRAAPTVPVLDGEPGQELLVDTGWVLVLEPDLFGKRRRVRAWIFTPHLSRYRFVYPCFRETTTTAIEACEAAWEFYGGVFRVLIPDNTKTIVLLADSLSPRIVPAFLEYAQARGFEIDPARPRHPKDKARVERTVRDVRDDCFGGERVTCVEDAQSRALTWSREEYGMRTHTTTRRMPRIHFETDEKPCLLPLPTEPYDIPEWSEPKVARDHFAQVAKGLYTLPTKLIGRRLRARADRATVRFYDRGVLVKTHARVAPGKKAIDPSDFPAQLTPYAMRDVIGLARQADEYGEAVGRYARALLEGRQPWTRMRQVRKLISLAKKFGDERTNKTCATALAAELVDVRRLERMLMLAAKPDSPRVAKIIPISRFLRPASQYALPLADRELSKQGEDNDD
jgi:transposase